MQQHLKVRRILNIDATIKIWDIPQDGLKEDLKTETQSLGGHLKKVAMVAWNPSVFEVLASGGFDNKVNIWNVLSGESIHSFTFNESLMSLEWNAIGSLLALSTKDKLIHILDPRANKADVVFIAELYRISKALLQLKTLKYVGLIQIMLLPLDTENKTTDRLDYGI